MDSISPEAVALQLDVSEGPTNYVLITLDAGGELVDILETFTNSEQAHAAAKEVAASSKLPFSLRRTPFG